MFTDDEVSALRIAETGVFSEGLRTIHYKDENETPVVRKAHNVFRIATGGGKFSGYTEQETIVSVKYNSAGHQVNNAYTY